MIFRLSGEKKPYVVFHSERNYYNIATYFSESYSIMEITKLLWE